MLKFYLLILIRGNISAQVVVGYQGETQLYWLLSDAETTIERSYTGVKAPLYRTIRPLIDPHESSEYWILKDILDPKGYVMRAWGPDQ